MKRCILESPFHSGTNPVIPAVVERNIRYVRECMRALLLKGFAPFVSHALYTLPGVLDDNKAEERKIGMEAGFVWTRALGVEYVFVFTDLGISPGMLAGIDNAKSWGRQIEHRQLGGKWARCARVEEELRPICSAPRGTETAHGTHHDYWCPMWRPQANGG